MSEAESADILLVDDDEDLRATLADLLEDCGYQVAQARNGREALTYLGANPRPGVIIFDLMMPGMSGQHLRAELVTMEHLREVPRLIFTAAGERHIQQAKVDPDPVIRKPLSIPLLLERLEALIGQPGSRR